MVDALCRTRLWLKSGGYLIDLRSADTIPQVVVGSNDRSSVVGGLTVETERQQRHAAADRTLATVLDRQLFVLEKLVSSRSIDMPTQRTSFAITSPASGKRLVWTRPPASRREGSC